MKEILNTLLDKGGDIDLVTLDLAIPGVRGFSGLMYIRAQYPSVPVIIVSGPSYDSHPMRVRPSPRCVSARGCQRPTTA